MSDKYLCLSLGHNSSAILIQDGAVVCGYEQERLSKIKSDSKFPRLAIEECLKYCDIEEIQTVFISHWSINGNYLSLPEKYYDKKYMEMFGDIVSLSENFTHHDAHYWSAKAFAKEFDADFTVVADGFGTNWEFLSIYQGNNLVKRSCGIESLGLLYQYATNFLGLKMHQDEYKLLGYEIYIDTLDSLKIEFLDDYIDDLSIQLPPNFYSLILKTFDDLSILKHKYNVLFTDIIESLNIKKGSFVEKIVIAYLVQSIIEKSMLKIIDSYNMKSVLLVGGLFLNVKLNNIIAKKVDKICVMPLCGDQGAALGVYNYCRRDLYIKDLYWGLRDINVKELAKDIIILKKSNCVKELIRLINANRIINVVHGPMEFGSRALCNTSTLAYPSKENVKYINFVNNRDNIMPMAPVMTDPSILFSNKDINKIHRSLEFMVITLDHLFELNEDIKSIAHEYPLKPKFSSRIQIINKNHILYDLVDYYYILINTSFNIHGTPIVYDVNDINKAHKYQKSLDHLDQIRTVFILD